MDTLSAWANGVANRGKEMKVFDWDKAAQLIKDNQPKVAGAGLSGDWEWTGGDIYRNGAPVNRSDTYVYLSSTWATPELSMDYDVVDCWIWESEAQRRWGDVYFAAIYWPDSALNILHSRADNNG